CSLPWAILFAVWQTKKYQKTVAMSPVPSVFLNLSWVSSTLPAVDFRLNLRQHRLGFGTNMLLHHCGCARVRSDALEKAYCQDVRQGVIVAFCKVVDETTYRAHEILIGKSLQHFIGE